MSYSIEFSTEFEKSIKKLKKKDKTAFEQIQKKLMTSWARKFIYPKMIKYTI